MSHRGNFGELLHHEQRAGQEEMTEIQVVSGKKFNTSYRDISVVVSESNSVIKPKCE